MNGADGAKRPKRTSITRRSVLRRAGPARPGRLRGGQADQPAQVAAKLDRQHVGRRNRRASGRDARKKPKKPSDEQMAANQSSDERGTSLR
jgi:hypothetical protein